MKNYCMKALVVLCVLGLAGAAWAAEEASITVTVSLESTLSVELDSTAWNIGAVGLGATSAPAAFTASVGNTATTLEIAATAPAGGWSLGAASGTDTCVVAVDDPAITLTTEGQLLDTVAAYGSKNFSLTFTAPDADTIGAGVAQGFQISVKASATP